MAFWGGWNVNPRTSHGWMASRVPHGRRATIVLSGKAAAKRSSRRRAAVKPRRAHVDLLRVRSTQGAALVFQPARSRGSPPEPGVPVVPAPGSPQVPLGIVVVHPVVGHGVGMAVPR
jgi:hypothetical protein